MDKDKQDQNILEKINNTAKFKKLKETPKLTRERQLQFSLRKVKREKRFDENRCRKIQPHASKPATMWDLPKTQKMLSDSDDFSLQVIVSSIGTIFLNSVIPKEYSAKDSFSYSEEMQQRSDNNFS